VIDLPAGSAWIVLGSVWLGIGLCALDWGGLAPPEDASGLDRAVALGGGAVWMAAVGVLIASAWCIVRPSRSTGALALAGVCLGLCCAKSAARPLDVRGAGRGQASLIELEIQGAPRPGGNCARRVAAATAWFERWPTACDGSHGDRFVVRRDALVRVPPAAPGVPAGRLEVQATDAWSSRRTAAHPRGMVEAARRRYWAFVARLRQRAWSWSRGDDARGMVVASTLGLPGALSPRGRRTLRSAGLGHLIAVSGLHVGLLAMFVMRLALRCTGGRAAGLWIATVLGSLVVLGFVGVTGGAAPAVRAAAMFLVATFAAVLGRPTHRRLMPAWVLTVMVVARPAWIVDPGFQLTAAATWAIVTGDALGSGGEADVTAVERSLGEGWRAVGDVVWISWRIAWATAAVSAFWFGRIAWTSILVNVLAVPIFAWVVLPFAGLGWLAMAFGGSPGFFAVLASCGASAILDLGAVATVFGDGMAPRGALSLGVTAWVVVSLVSARRPRATRWRPPAWSLVGLALAATLGGASPQRGANPPGLVAVAAGRARSDAIYLRTGNGVHSRPCLDVSNGTVIDWPRWLEALDLPPPALVRGEGPAADALRRRWSAGRVGPDERACDGVAAARRSVIDACRSRYGQQRAVVLMPTSGPARCRVHGGWRPL